MPKKKGWVRKDKSGSKKGNMNREQDKSAKKRPLLYDHPRSKR